MKIMTQDKTRVLNFKMTYISYVSKNRICEGDFGIAEYASPERAKEVLNDMFQKYAAELYADFVQSDEVRNSMRATADKVTECMDGIRELNELEGQLETEKQESEDKI